MGAFLRKYNTLTVTGTTAIRIPIVKRAVVDFAVSADWTPAAGDVKIAIDGAAAANVTNLPTAVAMGNTAYWQFILTAAELTCKSCVVTVADSATKAVEDQSFVVETFGHASAMYPIDYSDSVRLGLTALPSAAADAAGGLPISDAGGLDLDAKIGALTFTVANKVDANTTHISGDSIAADNAEAFFDGTGYAGTNNVIPLVTTTTTATNVTTVNGLAANVITAASIATGAIDADAIADGAIDAGAIAADAITAAKIADGAIDAATFAAGAIDAAAIAANAIGASELAADAVAEIADAVWDEATSGHVASGSFGQALFPIRANTAQAGANGSITLDASASAVDDFYKNSLVVLTGGTGANQVRTISGYTGATKVATVTPNWGTNPDVTSVFVILPNGAIAGASAPTAGEVADAVWDEARAGHVSAGSFGEYVFADATRISGDATAADNLELFFDGTGYNAANSTVGTVTLVTTTTNLTNLPTIPANWLTAAGTAADFGTEVGTAVWASGTRTVTSLSGLTVDTVTTLTNLPAITSNWLTAAGLAADAGVEIAAAVWDRVLTGATHNIANSAGRRLRTLDSTSIIDGTAAAGATNSITLDGTASATNEIYDDNLIVITGGTGAGQTRVIVEYNGTTKVAIVNRVWETTPSTDSTYAIIAGAQAIIAQHGLAQGGAATTITLASTASAVDDIYIGSQVYISTSTGAGQTRLITDYVGATKVATVSPDWVTNPTSSSVYNIIPIGRAIVDSGTVTTLTNLPAITANWLTAAGLATDAVTEIVTAVLTTAMTESYNADGSPPTVAQALHVIMQTLTEMAISGTTTTVKKLDGTTTAFTLTLNSAVTPTSVTRAT